MFAVCMLFAVVLNISNCTYLKEKLYKNKICNSNHFIMQLFIRSNYGMQKIWITSKKNNNLRIIIIII